MCSESNNRYSQQSTLLQCMQAAYCAMIHEQLRQKKKKRASVEACWLANRRKLAGSSCCFILSPAKEQAPSNWLKSNRAILIPFKKSSAIPSLFDMQIIPFVPLLWSFTSEKHSAMCYPYVCDSEIKEDTFSQSLLRWSQKIIYH